MAANGPVKCHLMWGTLRVPVDDVTIYCSNDTATGHGSGITALLTHFWHRFPIGSRVQVLQDGQRHFAPTAIFRVLPSTEQSSHTTTY